MKRILLAMMLGIGILSFAQDSEEKIKGMIKEQIVDKIKNYKLTDLVPYSKDGKKWALMDVKSRKILTDFVLNYSDTFDPEFYVNIDINGLEEEMKISSDYMIRPIMRETILVPYKASKAVESMEEPGFQMDRKGEMTKLNFKYRYFSNPILYKGVYYAVVKQGENRILINQKGEELEGFHFEMMEEIIHYKDKESGETIFYVEGFDGKKGLVTISGKKKLYGELLQDVYNGILGYIVQKDGESTDEIKKSGIVDMITQEWLIKPQEKYKIYDIIYTSSEALNIWRSSVKDRDKANIYFLATDQSGQHFVLDIKGNPILPKN